MLINIAIIIRRNAAHMSRALSILMTLALCFKSKVSEHSIYIIVFIAIFLYYEEIYKVHACIEAVRSCCPITMIDGPWQINKLLTMIRSPL